MVRAALCSSRALRYRSFCWDGLRSIFSCSSREAPLADAPIHPLMRPLPDGIVPADEVARTEKHWLFVMVGMLAFMMAIIVVTGMTGAIHPPSNVETISPTTLH